jgi:hypothetical protein
MSKKDIMVVAVFLYKNYKKYFKYSIKIISMLISCGNEEKNMTPLTGQVTRKLKSD